MTVNGAHRSDMVLVLLVVDKSMTLSMQKFALEGFNMVCQQEEETFITLDR